MNNNKAKIIPSKEIKAPVINVTILLICSVVGVFVKHIINPICNMITDMLHVPGGISTSVALMFLVIACGVTGKKWSASFMGLTQGLIAVSIGMIGSMGPLMALAYLIPGVVIDLVMLIKVDQRIGMFLANTLASIAAALFANFMVFHLPGIVLLVYICLSAVTGAACGMMAGSVTEEIQSKLSKE